MSKNTPVSESAHGIATDMTISISVEQISFNVDGEFRVLQLTDDVKPMVDAIWVAMSRPEYYSIDVYYSGQTATQVVVKNRRRGDPVWKNE